LQLACSEQSALGQHPVLVSLSHTNLRPTSLRYGATPSRGSPCASSASRGPSRPFAARAPLPPRRSSAKLVQAPTCGQPLRSLPQPLSVTPPTGCPLDAPTAAQSQ